MTNTVPSRGELPRMVALRLGIAIPVVMGILFIPAGTFAYWQAWVYLGVVFIPMLFVVAYLFKNDPVLLERRMRKKEKQTEQKTIVKLSFFFFLLAFLLPGLDFRFGWSNVPTPVVIAADVLVLVGYSLVFMVFRENRYASRVIEVETEQKVISTGVYSIVRHPMYLGAILMYVFSPLALGSYWAMLPALVIVPLLVARIRNEENVLEKELKGYREYMQHTRYHLVPRIW